MLHADRNRNQSLLLLVKRVSAVGNTLRESVVQPDTALCEHQQSPFGVIFLPKNRQEVLFPLCRNNNSIALFISIVKSRQTAVDCQKPAGSTFFLDWTTFIIT